MVSTRLEYPRPKNLSHLCHSHKPHQTHSLPSLIPSILEKREDKCEERASFKPSQVKPSSHLLRIKERLIDRSQEEKSRTEPRAKSHNPSEQIRTLPVHPRIPLSRHLLPASNRPSALSLLQHHEADGDGSDEADDDDVAWSA